MGETASGGPGRPLRRAYRRTGAVPLSVPGPKSGIGGVEQDDHPSSVCNGPGTALQRPRCTTSGFGQRSWLPRSLRLTTWRTWCRYSSITTWPASRPVSPTLSTISETPTAPTPSGAPVHIGWLVQAVTSIFRKRVPEVRRLRARRRSGDILRKCPSAQMSVESPKATW